MYGIDFKRIEDQLAYLRTCLNVLDEVIPLESQPAQFAAARALHVAIECVTDIGNALIDGFFMRDPGSYEDIVEILKDESVLPEEEGEQIKRLVECRRKLVVQYTDVDKKELERLTALADALKPFSRRIGEYLKQELGENVPPFDI